MPTRRAGGRGGGGPASPDRDPSDDLASPIEVTSAVAEAFLARSDDLMVLLDDLGRITWAGPSSERFLGLAPAALVGRSGLDLTDPMDHDRVAAAFAAVAARGDHVRVELRLAGGEGPVRWVEAVLTNLREEPDIGGIVGHLRDITERRAAEQAVQFQAAILDAVGQAITARDLDGVATYWNPAATALFGFTADEVVGRRLGDLVAPAPGHVEELTAAHQAHLEARPWSAEVAVIAGGGRTIHVHTTSTPVYDRDGRHVGTITASNDLTESRRQRRRTEEDHRRLADAQASAHLGSFEIDLRTGDLVGSDELWRILGRPPTDLRRLEHVHPDDLPEFRAALRAAAEGSNAVACTHRIVRPDGVVRWVTSRSSQFHSADTTILTGTMLDITERHEAEQALRHQATHDQLTGLVNRRLFLDRVQAVLDLDPAVVDHVVLLFVDLDDFTSVNDRVGHVDADDVLRRVGRRIASAVPAEASVGRLGGDEFVVCVDRLHHRDDAQALVDAVQQAIRRPIEVGTATFALDASIGLALADTERRAEGLLRNADAAMYAAKRAGGGRVAFFDDDLARRDRRRTELVAELRTALDEGTVETHFQPEVHLADGALLGFEALARWTHPRLGRVAPDEFIPLAEESGLIGELGRRMLENTGRALAAWARLRPELALAVGVNVAPSQIADPTFPEVVREVVERFDLRPGQLCLEVTESALMDSLVASVAIGQLRAHGVTVAIDDFGTGYSSFGRLKLLPIDFLKIDQSFVADIGRSPADDVIITTMATLARSLGVAVIAEGIETEAQRRFLADLGCEYGQGWLWSRALPEAEATGIVEDEPPPHR